MISQPLHQKRTKHHLKIEKVMTQLQTCEYMTIQLNQQASIELLSEATKKVTQTEIRRYTVQVGEYVYTIPIIGVLHKLVIFPTFTRLLKAIHQKSLTDFPSGQVGDTSIVQECAQVGWHKTKTMVNAALCYM